MSYRLRPQAEADIEAIALYIAEDSPSAALRWYEEIHRRCRRIGEMPSMGVGRPEVRPDLKSLPVGNYLILYRQKDDGAEIARVVHCARLMNPLISGDSKKPDFWIPPLPGWRIGRRGSDASAEGAI